MSNLRPGQDEFARRASSVEGWSSSADGSISLLDTVRGSKPTVLIGVSGQAGAFTEEVVRQMSRHTDRPAILPLSNPSKLSEGTPQEINLWSEGKALMATGSPFGPVNIPGKEKKYIVAESNNGECCRRDQLSITNWSLTRRLDCSNDLPRFSSGRDRLSRNQAL